MKISTICLAQDPTTLQSNKENREQRNTNGQNFRLYQKCKLVNAQRQKRQNEELLKIKELSNTKKISGFSSTLLKTKFLARTHDIISKINQSITMEISIEILKQLGVLKLFESIEDLEQKHNKSVCERERRQIQFVYRLWKSIDTEWISAQQFQSILQILIVETFDCSDSGQQKQLSKLFYHLTTHQSKKMPDIQNQETFRPYVSPESRLFSQRQLIRFSKQHNLEVQNYDSYDLLRKRDLVKQIKMQQSKSERLSAELQKCSFNPSISKSTFHDETHVVTRLYNGRYTTQRERLKEAGQQQKYQKQLAACTFKPQVLHKKKQFVTPKVKGYQKTIERLRQANAINAQIQKKLSHIPRGQNYDIMRQKKSNPPKFLDRKKTQCQQTLFYIQFDIGHRSVRVNIKAGQSPEKLAAELRKIYSLNQEQEAEIADIITEEILKYHNLNDTS